MRTKLRSKVTLLFMTCALLIAVPAVALADELANNVDDTIENNREEVNLDSHGKSATVEIYVNATTGSGDSDAGCNFDAATEMLKLRVFEQSDPNNAVSSVVWDETGAITTNASTPNDTIEFTGCGLANSKTVKVTSAHVSPATGTTFDANIDFEIPSGGNTAGGSFDTQTGRFTVKVAKDVTAPDTTITSGPAEGSTVNSNSATFEFTSTEANSTFECKLDSGTFAACTSPQVLSSLADGSRNFQVRAIDAAGNVDQSPASRSWTVQTDSTAPTTTASAKNADDSTYTAGTWTNQNVTVTLNAQDNDGGSGVKEIRYTTDGTNPTASSGTVYSAPFTVSSTTTVKFLAVDNANNAEAVKSFQVNIDKNAPAPNCGSASPNWLATDASLACTPTDSGGSGLASSVPASFNLVTNVAAGQENANASTDSRTISDVAGNTATAGPIGGNKIDKKAPGYSCNPASAPTAWQSNNVSFSCTASDGGSGLASTSPASFNLATSVAANTETSNASTNSQALSDAVGNSATAVFNGIKVDRKAPVVLCGSADGNWHATNVSIACTASDNGSGLTSTGDASFNLTTSVAANTEDSNASTNSRTVSDAVGHSATAGPIPGNKVDRKAPEVSYVGQTAASTNFNVAGLNGWFISPVQVEFSATDGGSGLVSGVTSPFTKDSGTQQGSAVTVASGSVADAVGNTNVGVNSPVSFKVDLTNPSTPTFSGIQAATYPVADLPAQNAISCSATDTPSGLDSCVVTGYSSAFGSHTLTATATDLAGRKSTSQLVYIVGLKAGEVLSPINSTGKANPAATNLDSFKIKSTVPVKFRLFNDALMQQLMTSPPAGSVAKLTFFKYDSDTSTTDLTESLTGLTPNTDNIFRWDATNSQYVYNLGTSGRTAGTYGVQLTLFDSSGTVLAQSAKYYFVLRS